jgi:phage-related protein
MLDLGTLRIGVKVDSGEAKSQLNEVAGSVEGTGGKVAELASKAKTMIKAFAAAWAVKELVKLGKAALDAYAQYEQLEGGVKKLFGEEAAKDVMKYAENAYKTAGISANEYMEQATSFSASLISSLNGDTQKAAQVTDMAIQDMADNANVFGSDMASIQNAYQGFAKQNYTMLDNLKLGYVGTKEEMQRLLEDAEKLSGQEYDISNLSDVYEAIHVVQQEMGITGTTSKEAATTIDGSTRQMKASWENLLTAIGRGEGVEEATQNFLNSLGTLAKNIAPVAVTIIKSLAVAIVKAAVYLVQAGAEAMKKFIEGFLDAHPQIAEAVEKIGSVFDTVFNAVVSVIQTVVDWWKKLMGQKGTKTFSISAPFSGAIQSIKDVHSKWSNVLGQAASKSYSIVKNGFESALDSMKSIYNKWKDILGQAATKVFNVITNNTSNSSSGSSSKKSSSKKSSKKKKRIGLREVPYDGYQAELHKGESILTAAESNQYKKYLSGLESAASGIVNGINASNMMMSSGSTEARIVINLGGTKVAEQIFRLNKQGKLAFEG